MIDIVRSTQNPPQRSAGEVQSLRLVAGEKGSLFTPLSSIEQSALSATVSLQFVYQFHKTRLDSNKSYICA